MSRKHPLDAGAFSDEQLRLCDDLIAGPRGKFTGPFPIWIASTAGFRAAEGLGTFARYSSSLDSILREFAILLTARHWDCVYEWTMHSQHAKAAGLSEAIVTSLAEGRRPNGLNERFAVVYDAAQVLLGQKRVDDELFGRLSGVFSEAELIDLLLTLGYYSMVAITLNTFAVEPEVPAPIPLIVAS